MSRNARTIAQKVKLTYFIRKFAEQRAANECQKALQGLHDAHCQITVLAEGIHNHSGDQRPNQAHGQVLQEEHRQDDGVIHLWLG